MIHESFDKFGRNEFFKMPGEKHTTWKKRDSEKFTRFFNVLTEQSDRIVTKMPFVEINSHDFEEKNLWVKLKSLVKQTAHLVNKKQ